MAVEEIRKVPAVPLRVVPLVMTLYARAEENPSKKSNRQASDIALDNLLLLFQKSVLYFINFQIKIFYLKAQ
jgi:hypothetical protein